LIDAVNLEIQDAIAASRHTPVPFDWNSQDVASQVKEKVPVEARDIPPSGSRNGDIEDFLRSRGRSQDYIESYIRGWRQLDKKV
jgi:hypothetical protein